MLELNFEEYLKISFNTLSMEELKGVLEEIISVVGSAFKIKPLDKDFQIIFENGDLKEYKNYFKTEDIGAKRFYTKNKLFIQFDKAYEEFAPIIIIREAFYFFIPKELLHKMAIRILINSLITLSFKKIKLLDDWEDTFKGSIVSSKSPETIKEHQQYAKGLTETSYRFLKLLKLQLESIGGPIHYIFEYFRSHANILEIEEDVDFYDNLWKDVVFYITKSLRDDEVIETIRILIKIFYKVKSYRALLDYKTHFKDFLEKGYIKTDLSLRKFESRVQWINNNTYLAPSYQVNWLAIGAKIMVLYMRFHPQIKTNDFFRILKYIPFLLFTKPSLSGMARDLYGTLLIPRQYVNKLIRLFKSLKDDGILTDFLINDYYQADNHINLNYFRSFHNLERLANPKHIKYDDRYEIHFSIEYPETENRCTLDTIDWDILNRVRYWSITGFPFERRENTLAMLKEDVEAFVDSQEKFIENLNYSIKKLHDEPSYKTELINIIESKNHKGFFYFLEYFDALYEGLTSLKKRIDTSEQKTTISDFKKILEEQTLSRSFLKYMKIKNMKIDRSLYKIISREGSNFSNLIEKLIEKFGIYNAIFYCFNALKIVNLRDIKFLIEREEESYKLIEKKRNKHKQSFKGLKTTLNDLSSENLEEIIEKFCNFNPPVIKPLLTGTINTTYFSKYYYVFFVNLNKETETNLNDLIKYFPRVLIFKGVDIETKRSILSIEIYQPNIREGEKFSLISLVNTLFGDDLILFKRFYNDGLRTSYSLKDYYDFNTLDYFYTDTLTEESYRYIKNIVGPLKPLKEENFEFHHNLWEDVENPDDLIKIVSNRVAKEKNDFSQELINDLRKFQLNLGELLLSEDFKQIKSADFFKTYIDSIKLFPVFRLFGFSQYFVLFRPSKINEIDFKLILSNNFQQLWYPSQVSPSNFFLIRYIFPYNSPNDSYFRRLFKTHKAFSEYCIFKVKRLSIIFQLDLNINSDGWDYNEKRLRAHATNILFNKELRKKYPSLNFHDIGELKPSEVYGKESEEYKNLIKFYSRSSKDIKPILGTRQTKNIIKLQHLIKNGLTIPYLKLKNIGLIEKLYLLIFDIDNKYFEDLVKILNFFNFGLIYEIDGEYFIYGNNESKSFERNLFVKIYMPHTDLDRFQDVFREIFAYMGIERYLLFTDLVKGKVMLNSIFGVIDLEKHYNPLKNMEWSEKDQIWLNPKLLNQKFEPQYPDLIPNDDK